MRRCLKTRPISSYFTFASGGYIMRISPMAMGNGGCADDETVEKGHDARGQGSRVRRPLPWL